MNTSVIHNSEVYLDDTVAYTSNWNDRVKTLCEIFAHLHAASITLNLAECEFGCCYLGKKLRHGYVSPVPAEVQAVLDCPGLQTRLEHRRFLGITGYYHALSKNVADVTAPLTSLVSPNKPLKWSE